MLSFRTYMKELNELLEATIVTDKNGLEIDTDEGLERFAKIGVEVRNAGRGLYFIGNGASATMSSHMAADADKNGGFRAMAFNDAASLTAISNDIGYDAVFSLPIERYGQPGDLLITISSSGNSENVVKAIETAQTKGVNVVTLSGMKPDNRSRQMGDLNFFAPSMFYGTVECAHQAILHCWLDRVIEIAIDKRHGYHDNHPTED